MGFPLQSPNKKSIAYSLISKYSKVCMEKSCSAWVPRIILIDLCIFNRYSKSKIIFLKLVCSQDSRCMEEGTHRRLESKQLEMFAIN